MTNITEIKGNIFESNCKAIVNTVNCEGFMGKGIALSYKLRFPEMYESYQKLCRNKMLKQGDLHIYKDSKPWIVNFPTKLYWRFPSKIEYIVLGLKKFTEIYEKEGITSVAFPELGTSQGGLAWEGVKKLMYLHLDSLKDIKIEIYHFDPYARDSLFDEFCNKSKGFTVEDYELKLKIRKKQVVALVDAINSGMIRSMNDFHILPGVGESTLRKIYGFASEESHEFKALQKTFSQERLL